METGSELHKGTWMIHQHLLSSAPALPSLRKPQVHDAGPSLKVELADPASGTPNLARPQEGGEPRYVGCSVVHESLECSGNF